MLDLPFLLFGAVICGLIGSAIGSSKAQSGLGFLLGFMLGPIGWIIVLLLPAPRPSVRAAVLARTPPKLVATVNPAGVLLDLKKLLDAQAITQAEYDEKKRILLAQIVPVPLLKTESAVSYKTITDL